MNIEEFAQNSQTRWKALSDLTIYGERDIKRLSPQQIVQLGQLYREATSDLALAQRDFPRHRVTQYLNQLVGRAHGVVYRSEPLALKRLMAFISTGFPRAYRQSGRYIAIAAFLMLIPALLAGMAVSAQGDTARWLLPASADIIPLLENHELWTKIPIAERAYTSSFIMQNNIQVSILAFGGGMLAGLMTVWILITNGIMLGVMTGLTSSYGLGFELWTFVIGHGVIELSVITICGGAGLQIGHAMIQPGLLRRRDAVVEASRKAVRLIVPCIGLLVVAGTIEGFISPNEQILSTLKWLLGIGTGIALYSYLLLAGRSKTQTENNL